MRFHFKLTALVLILFCVYQSEAIFGGRRRRRLFPPIRIPPIRIPPIRIPPIRIPPIRRIVRTIGKGIVKGITTIGKGIVSLAKGCCGLHPSICNNEKEYKNRQNDIKTKSAKMDRDWISVKKTLANIKTANADNSQIYREVRRITLVSTGTIEILDPQVLVKFNNVSSELKIAIRHKNQTVINYGINQLDKEFDNKKKETETALLDASGIGGFGMTTGYLKMTADMFRLVKLDMVANFLESDVGGFLNKAKLGVSKLFGFHYLEQLGKQNKIVGGILKAFMFYNNYLSLHGGVFKLMEGFGKLVGWITDLAGCSSRGKKIRKALNELKVDHKKINDAFIKLQAYKKDVSKNWATVRAQIQSDGLFTNLAIVENIAKQSSSQSAKSKKALADIIYFRTHIRRANAANTIKIQKKLLLALGSITYTMECYQRKLGMYQAVHTRCKIGQGSFDELYARAEIDFKPNTAECKTGSGLPYTTKTDVLKYVKTKANKEKFEINCLLNSGVKKALACGRSNEGYTISEVAKQMKSDLATVKSYLDACPIPVLTPSDQKQICMFKKDNLKENELYKKFPKIEHVKINNIFANCG